MKEEMSCECIGPLYQLPEALRVVIESFLPPEQPKPKGGRPRESDLKMMTAIFFLLRTVHYYLLTHITLKFHAGVLKWCC